MYLSPVGEPRLLAAQADSASIIETGFLIASVRRSGRPASLLDEGRSLRMPRCSGLPKVCRTPATLAPVMRPMRLVARSRKLLPSVAA